MINFKDINNINLESLEGPLKRVALMHDISGFGKASLTVALPIFSAANIEGALIPTAILSTHTGEFKDFTYRDLTEDLESYIKHWNDLEIHFDSIYSGYLSSPDQVDILIDFIRFQKKRNPELLVAVDPVMGDNGVLYTSYKEKMVEKNKELIKKADIIFPNLTEACYLINENYEDSNYKKKDIKRILNKLKEFGPKRIVLTGIKINDGTLGVAVLDHDKFDLIEIPKVNGKFHGTGDVFASFTLASLLNNKSLLDSVKLASVMTYYATKRTEKRNTPRRDGVDFEGVLPTFIKELNIE